MIGQGDEEGYADEDEEWDEEESFDEGCDIVGSNMIPEFNNKKTIIVQQRHSEMFGVRGGVGRGLLRNRSSSLKINRLNTYDKK